MSSLVSRIKGIRNSFFRMPFYFALLVLLFPPLIGRAQAESAGGYEEELVRLARASQLSKERYWEILLHYKPAGAGLESLVDDPNFFLAPGGKTEPQAELEALLKGLFRDATLGDEHPRCRFPARYAWLKEELSIDEAMLPQVACAEYSALYADINPQSSVLIFPAAHGNGPASMFGHTLLRIDGESRSDLLSFAVNYAASADDTNGFVYAYKGIFGRYKGYFSLRPYYEKVSEYNNIESRDIWEYALNLSGEETGRMVRHVWELKGIYSDYYFFDENCSFDLLFLLEAARPSVSLTDRFEGLKFWVIPSDTVRVIEENGLISGVKYRPSRTTRILSLEATMKPEQRTLSLEIVTGSRAPQTVSDMTASRDEKARILDLSAEMLQYRYATRQMPKEQYLSRFLPALKTRSGFGTSPADAPDIKRPISPDQGHLPGKVSGAAGYQGRSLFSEIGWRAAYHDLLDADDGFVEGAAINFFDLNARYYPRENQTRLQSAHFIDITSLAPRDAFFKPVSWKVLTGFDRKLFPDGKESLIYRINPGGGLAYRTGGVGIAYVMLESDVNFCEKFKDRFSLGLGPSAGILATATDSWKLHLSAQGLFYELRERHQSVRVTLAQNFRITTNNSVRLTVSREKTFDRYQSEVKVGWNFYL